MTVAAGKYTSPGLNKGIDIMRITTVWLAAVVLSASLSGCATTSARENKSKAADYYAQLGAGYLQKNRLSLAKEYLEKALASNRNSSDAQHYYAVLQDRLGDHAQAGTYFRKAMQSDGKNPELLNNYGSHLCRHGRYEEAIAAFMAALNDPLYKTPEYAYTNAGICLQKHQKGGQAEGYFRRALERTPSFPLALYQMAELEFARGENAKAQAFLYRYNEQSQETAETLLLCYKINRALHEPEQAEKCATNLMARFPNSDEAKSLN